MKKFWAAAILLLAAVGIVIVATKNFSTAPEEDPPVNFAGGPAVVSSNAPNPSPPAATVAPPENLAAKAGELPPPPPVATNVPAMILLQNARRAIVNYAQVYGGNPVGVNSEITAALMGKNPKHINFITPDSGLQVNDQGEMLDAWGTPLFFHQLSGHDMEIHSAGADRKLWTFDDLVIH